MAPVMDLQKDFARTLEKFSRGKEIDIPLRRLHSAEEMFVYGCLRQLFSEQDILHMLDPIQEAVRELLRMAEISAALPDYQANLTEEELSKIGQTESLLDHLHRAAISGLKESFNVRLKHSGDSLLIQVYFPFHNTGRKNNDNEPHESEEHPLARSAEYRLSLVLLDQAGIPRDHQSLKIKGKQATIEVNVPLNALSAPSFEIDSAIQSEMESLPAFPPNIKKIMDLCESQGSSVQNIAAAIAEDQSLAAEVLKLANSGAFAGGGISSMTEAVKLVGVQTISSLLLKVGAFRIMEDQFGLTEELLTYPVEVGIIARETARNYRMNQLVDPAHTAGLLHHIGYVFLYAVKRGDSTMKIIYTDREARARLLLEERRWGISHASIGARIARSWNLPEGLCQSIEYHHRPSLSPEQGKELSALVYIADAIHQHRIDKLNFYSLNPTVLEKYQLISPEAFQMMAGKIISKIA